MYSVENMWGFFFLRSYGAGRRRNVHYERIFFEEKRKRKSFAASTKSLVAAWGLCVTQRVGSLPIFLLDIYLRYVRTAVGVNNIVDCCWFLQSLFLHRHRGDMCYMEQKKREEEKRRGNEETAGQWWSIRTIAKGKWIRERDQLARLLPFYRFLGRRRRRRYFDYVLRKHLTCRALPLKLSSLSLFFSWRRRFRSRSPPRRRRGSNET